MLQTHDNIPDDVRGLLEELLKRVEKLEDEVAALKEAPASIEEPEETSEGEPKEEAIDLDIDIPLGISGTYHEEGADGTEAEAAHGTAEETQSGDEADAGPGDAAEAAEETQSGDRTERQAPEVKEIETLFGEIAEEEPKRAHRREGKAVMDVMADKCAWLHDIPGTEVKSLRSAIALGDQIVYIRKLFRDDTALYQSTIEKLNGMKTLKDAVAYIGETFPEWDTEGDDVYRFMMAVRRKIRR